MHYIAVPIILRPTADSPSVFFRIDYYLDAMSTREHSRFSEYKLHVVIL